METGTETLYVKDYGKPDGAEKMRARMKTESTRDNPAMQDYREPEGYQDGEQGADYPSGSEYDMQPQNDEDTINKSMQQGLDMLKGQFGN